MYYKSKELFNGLTFEEQKEKYNEILEDIIKKESLLSSWTFYEEYDSFLEHLKKNILNLDKEYFNIIVNSLIHLGNFIDIVWMELNDDTLKNKYNYDNALNEYKNNVKKNGYECKKSDEEYDGFKIILHLLDYKRLNTDLYDKLFKLKKDLDNKKFDNMLNIRTKENWEVLYAIRYLYKNVVNKILSDKNHELKIVYNNYNLFDKSLLTFDENTSIDELYKIKKNLEDWLIIYQDTIEGLDWHNPYSKKFIDNIEYFPRVTSKPPYDYAYSSYYNLETDALNIINNMFAFRKKKQEETQNMINERFKKIYELYEQRNNKIKNSISFTKYMYISVVVGFISAITYSYFL